MSHKTMVLILEHDSPRQTSFSFNMKKGTRIFFSEKKKPFVFHIKSQMCSEGRESVNDGKLLCKAGM